ncbi:MAG: cytochrome c1 [Gammaproteobacteria bacterium]|nr:cytochrome c1 [Gammaproteobacteria bacterium]
MKFLLILLIVCVSNPLLASATEVELEEASINLEDNDSIANGAKLYVEYCASCHSLKHVRYSRIAEDYGLSEEWMKDNVIPEHLKPHDSMLTAMKSEDSRVWFGMPPPDLSLIARSKGSDWLYSYLLSFYVDENQPYGVNNIVSPNIAMPDVLSPLRGVQEKRKAGSGSIKSQLKVVSRGSMNSAEFERAMTDLVAFLTYASEPSRSIRESIGKYVILFLIFFTVLAYWLKKEYWRDVH